MPDAAEMQDTQRAMYNILEDFAQEKQDLGELQAATLNILEDLQQERDEAEAARKELSLKVEELSRSEEANRALADSLAAHARELEASNRELESFSYSVSHDLRAPLRHISGFVELLERSSAAALDDQGRHCLEVIRSSSKRLGDLIDKLLSYSRMGKAEMILSECDMDDLLESVLKGLEVDARDREIEWVIQPLGRVLGDRSMLELVLQNLVGNALKYSRDRPKARIEIARREAGDEVVFCVKDNGVGFDSQYASKLFGVFQRLHSQEEFEGSGIGLANVRRLIERHGGATCAEGALDQGAAFYFSLPTRDRGAFPGKAGSATQRKSE